MWSMRGIYKKEKKKQKQNHSDIRCMPSRTSIFKDTAVLLLLSIYWISIFIDYVISLNKKEVAINISEINLVETKM